MKATSLFHLAINEEVFDILESETEEVQQSENNYGDDDGNLYFPLSDSDLESNTESIFYDEDEELKIPEQRTKTFLYNMIDNEVVTIDYDLSKDFDIMSFLANLWKATEIYGVLIKSSTRSNFIINPLHPMTALSIKLGQVKIPKKGKIIIYKYHSDIRNDNNLSEFLNAEEKGYRSAYEKTWVRYIAQSKFFINSVQTKTVIQTPLEDIFRDIETFHFLEQYSSIFKIHAQKTSTNTNISSLLVPTQLIVDTIATPYYGMIYVKQPQRSSSSNGYNTGGFVSGNIDIRTSGYSLATGDGLSDGRNGGKVCTGSLPNTKESGWLTLNRVYLNSMWFDRIIPGNKKTVISLATTAKKIACSFYALEENNENNSN